MSKQIREVCNEYDDKYRLIAENTYDLIATIDPVTSEYKYLSPSHSKTIDYPIDELLGQNALNLIHPEDRSRIKKILHIGIMQGQGRAEYRWRSKEGSYIWLESIGKLVTSRYGENEIVLVSRDITERKRMEEALKSSEERYRLIVDNAQEGVSIINPVTFKPIFVNPALERISGYPLKEFLNINIFELVYSEDKDGLVKIVAEGMRTGKNTTGQYRCRNKDGVYIWLETNGILIKYEGEQRWFCVSRDISSKKNLEEQLQKQVDYQNNIMNNINDLFYTYNRDLLLTYVNRQTCEKMGYSFDELIGRSILEFVHDADRELVRNEAVSRLGEGGVSTYEHRVVTKKGQERLLRIKVSPILENEGITGGQVLAEDITDYRRMENKMLRLAQLHTVGEIAAGIGHEIRNPMTTIKGFLQIMSQNPQFSSHRGYFDLMLEELDRANSIISEFLSLAKNKVADLQQKDLTGIINAIYPLLQADALLAGKTVTLDLQEIPLLLLDEQEIRQLIINLVRNGLDAVNSGEQVSIRTYQEGGQVIMAVKDQGQGIDNKIKEKLGTPFFTTKEKGTGLGLAICYSIARRHDASIKVQSDEMGTIFLVSFKIPLTGLSDIDVLADKALHQDFRQKQG